MCVCVCVRESERERKRERERERESRRMCAVCCVLYTCILYPDGRSVIDCIFSIIHCRIVPDEIKVALKFIQVGIVMRLHPLPHGPEVHRLFYHIKIIWHLQREREREHK